MTKFKFVIVSKDDKFMMQKTDFPCESVFVGNNRDNIGKVYNRFLNESKDKNDCDYLVFMHSDVVLDANHLIEHISECGDKYDVMGLCGCSKISVSQHPLNWFCGSRGLNNYRWGCVTHGELNNSTSFFNSHSPDVTDHEVACIDGLCIIFGRRAIEDDTLRFDERLRFNCYDTDISFKCVLWKKARLGVLVEKDLQHYSVGRGILTEEFNQDEGILRSIFGIPNPQCDSNDR